LVDKLKVIDSRKHKITKTELKRAFHTFFQEIRYLYTYVQINRLGFIDFYRKATKEHKKVKFDNQTNLNTFYKKLKNSFLTINSSTLNNMIQEAEQHYLDIYYESHNRNKGIQKLKKINKRK